ncbi:methyl-accepting chemotaxis protein [Lutispora thermophila]|uniref:Methyl-accepting chemotaxis sensory transducer with Cache sensor n=1 Tax=Lutispora thermophila DSM 19022 TaxID=1122184 RepID=A0A1M6BQ51_9FIRM|nr:methyl-accepting chemotaxis protein [Lutispora thermophila]SHI50930.1 methyl-accepting chemotaxis sensory transducer with Cache sensor [Lutispora thermophila DSM 19022]
MTILWKAYILVSIAIGLCAIIARNNLIILSILIAALVAMKIGFVYAISIGTKKIHENLTSIVNGQLNINIRKTKVKAINRIAEKFNEYLDKVRSLTGQYVNLSDRTSKESQTMKMQAESLKITASEIASTVQNISEAVNSQADSTMSVKESIDIFTNGVENIYQNAWECLNAAKNSKSVVDESFETFKEAFLKMEEVKQHNDKVLQDMLKLNNSIKEISAITEAVESIASQTHLLALNASIEAARAGETGRGFAVVAGEVSKLADDSSNSAKKIKELIEGIIKDIDELSSNLKTETQVVENNVAYAEKAFKKSEDINEAVVKNMDAAQAIVDLTKEQKAKLDEIAQAIENISDTTQQNAAVVEEINASTEEQLSIIETMYDSILSLSDAIENSKEIIGNFMKGFNITDEIKSRVEAVKGMLTDISKVEGLLHMEETEGSQLFKEKQKNLSYVELIALVDENGRLLYSSPEVPVDQRSCSAREFFQRAVKGETYVSKEYISILTNHYNITVSIPIYEGGNVKGVLLADINLNDN